MTNGVCLLGLAGLDPALVANQYPPRLPAHHNSAGDHSVHEHMRELLSGFYPGLAARVQPIEMIRSSWPLSIKILVGKSPKGEHPLLKRPWRLESLAVLHTSLSSFSNRVTLGCSVSLVHTWNAATERDLQQFLIRSGYRAVPWLHFAWKMGGEC